MVSYLIMKIRVNRNGVKHRWTVQHEDGRRIGHAIGLLMESVTFVTQGPSGWADGTLVSWADLSVDPRFQEKVEARTVTYLELEGHVFFPLTFKDGHFFVLGKRVTSCSWLRILGSGAECSGSR